LDGEDGGTYRYPHDYEGHVVEQAYVPTSTTYYRPTDQGYEDTIGKRLQRWEQVRKQATADRDGDAAGKAPA
jgi:replication-associated recombination protein RarA